ncbi:MAG: hypothetical protein K2J39_03440 [Ruminococcus sp.]|nr:hypothetical protein [Ruminococcus sp.]
MERQKLKKPEKVVAYIFRGILCIAIGILIFCVMTANKNLYEKNNIFVILIYIMAFLWVAGGIFVIWAMIMSVRHYNILKENGITGIGEIAEITELKDMDGMKLYDVLYIYNDNNGNQQTGRTTFEKKPPDTDKYTVIYARKNSGKYISEMIH